MKAQSLLRRADRRSAQCLSSGARVGFLPALALLAGLAVPACAQPVPTTTSAQTLASGERIDSAIAQWRTLTANRLAGFEPLARFLVAHRGWPGETDLRKRAEAALTADSDSPSLVVSYFRVLAPQTATASLRQAEALTALGQRAEALAAARQAWLAGTLSAEDEGRFLSRFLSTLQAGDHDARMDKLLWQRDRAGAARQLSFTSADRRAVFDARLAFITKAPDAAAKALAVEASQTRSSGFIVDRVYWLRNTGQASEARSYLATLPPPVGAPADPMRWLDMLEGVIDDAIAAGDHNLATMIARQVQYTYPAGVAPRDRSAAERNGYTDVAWKGGFAALETLNRPRDALFLFDLYARAARSPQTRVKGLYWAGRAAERAGDVTAAKDYFSQASEFFDQFHGQMARERLGKPLALPDDVAAVEISAAERAQYQKSDLVAVTNYLGSTGPWQDQTRFIRALAAVATTPEQHQLGSTLALRLNRLDLAVLIARSARERGLPGYARLAFPIMPVPDEHAGSWTMIHAITRQESQFDREALSKAGARGLMQLIPSTAKMTAPAAGVPYDLAQLTADPLYNVRLGATYFGQLMTRYNGNYVLAVAAYNAGPGNVNKWIAANGDPRTPGVDVLDWIERIPFTETRGYVQRVLENAAVYELLNPRRPSGRPPARLSAFLGTTSTGYGSR